MKKGSKMLLPRIIWISILLLVAFLSCKGQKNSAIKEKSVMNEKMASTDSPLTLIAEGNYAGTDTATTHIIESQKGLAKFYSSVNKTRKPGLPVPKVDFSKQMVVIYCAGSDGDGTYPILDLARETDSELILSMINETEEDGNYSVSPFKVYSIPLTLKKISFKAVE